MSDDKPAADTPAVTDTAEQAAQATAAERTGATEAAKPQAPNYSRAQKKHLMHVKVYGPFKTYVDEDAYSISAANYTGPFDVLGEHHNFITILSPCDVVVHTLYDTKRIKINRGVMHVSQNDIVVFLDV